MWFLYFESNLKHYLVDRLHSVSTCTTKKSRYVLLESFAIKLRHHHAHVSPYQRDLLHTGSFFGWLEKTFGPTILTLSGKCKVFHFHQIWNIPIIILHANVYCLARITRKWFTNPTIYNIICWFAGLMGQMTRRPCVWHSKYYFFIISYIDLEHSKLFIFIFVILC